MARVSVKNALLTDLEIMIMKVLWDAEKMLTIREMSERLASINLSIESITQSIKHLENKKAIKICKFIPVKNVYARAFAPAISRDEYYVKAIKCLQKDMYGFKTADTVKIAEVLIDSSSEKEVEAIKECINQK